MTKKVLFLIVVIISCVCHMRAQDKVVLRDNTSLNVKIIESNEKDIIFTYPNEETKNVQAKSSIAYIIYASGRREQCNYTSLTMPAIENESDWEKVIVTYDRDNVNGYTMLKSISVSAGNGGIFNSASKAHESAIKKIKKKAAKLKGGMILILHENFGGQYNNISSITGEIYK